MDPISPLALTILGVVIAVLAFFLLTRSLESALFWSILIGPAIGSSLVNFLIQVLSGADLATATLSFQFMPFFIAAIDKSFFAPNGGLVIVGAILLFLWFYVIAHYATHKFGLWGIPMVPAIIFVAGLSLPNLRTQIATVFPSLTFLVEPFMGIGLLILMMAPLLFICYIASRRGYEIAIPLHEKLKG